MKTLFIALLSACAFFAQAQDTAVGTKISDSIVVFNRPVAEKDEGHLWFLDRMRDGADPNPFGGTFTPSEYHSLDTFVIIQNGTLIKSGVLRRGQVSVNFECGLSQAQKNAGVYCARDYSMIVLYEDKKLNTKKAVGLWDGIWIYIKGKPIKAKEGVLWYP